MASTSDRVAFGAFAFDLKTGELWKGGALLRLRPQPARALALLVNRAGTLVTRDEIRKHLWDDATFVDYDVAIDACINRIRTVLGDDARAPRLIETLPKRGYRFIGVLSGPSASAVRARAARRLLVLPFLNLSGDLGQDYRADAMTEEIIGELTAVLPEDMAVLARTTSMHYKGTDKTASEIGAEVNVDWIVEGSVRRSGDRYQLVAQLIRAADQAHEMVCRHDVEECDIFETQRQLAQAIVAQLGTPTASTAGGLEFPPRASVRRRPTEIVLAYDRYILGRYHLHRMNPEGIAVARRCFEDAVAADPTFALAHDALSQLFFFLGFYGLAPPRHVHAAGLVHALRALEIDPRLADVRATLGSYRAGLDYDWLDARREMDTAVQLDPKSPYVMATRGLTLSMPAGHLEEAIEEIEHAVELDPMSLWARTYLCLVLWLARRFDDADREARTIVAIDPAYAPGHMQLGHARYQAGRPAEAIASMQHASELTGGPPHIQRWLGAALAASGRAEEARALLARLVACHAYVPPTAFAWIHLELGEVDEGFEWMDKAIDARDPMMAPIRHYPFLDRFRADSRFPALLKKMNLDT